MGVARQRVLLYRYLPMPLIIPALNMSPFRDTFSKIYFPRYNFQYE